MKKKLLLAVLLLASAPLIIFSCKKETQQNSGTLGIDNHNDNTGLNLRESNNSNSIYNLEVVLRGAGNKNGHIHFRQNPDPARIVTLDTKVHNLLPNHEYRLQRAVDIILDGNCTGTNWLTLGWGLTAHSIFTDNKGDGQEVLWRNLSSIPPGSIFDIHFRVIDAVSMEVVLNSDCYQYTVR